MVSSVDHDWVGYTGEGKMRRNKGRREGQEILVSFFILTGSYRLVTPIFYMLVAIHMEHVVSKSAVGVGAL